MSKRTTINFHYTDDIWPVVESWARENNYRLVESSGPARVYQNGYGFLTAPMMLKIQGENQEAALEAWVKMNILTRAMALFILPAEMGIESGGLRAVIPRNMARAAVNKLLARLGQPPIP